MSPSSGSWNRLFFCVFCHIPLKVKTEKKTWKRIVRFSLPQLFLSAFVYFLFLTSLLKISILAGRDGTGGWKFIAPWALWKFCERIFVNRYEYFSITWFSISPDFIFNTGFRPKTYCLEGGRKFISFCLEQVWSLEDSAVNPRRKF